MKTKSTDPTLGLPEGVSPFDLLNADNSRLPSKGKVSCVRVLKLKPKHHNTASYVIGMHSALNDKPRYKHHGYCFWKPIGGFVPHTFDVNKTECYETAYLSLSRPRELFVDAKKRLKKQGCKVVKVRLEVVE